MLFGFNFPKDVKSWLIHDYWSGYLLSSVCHYFIFIAVGYMVISISNYKIQSVIKIKDWQLIEMINQRRMPEKEIAWFETQFFSFSSSNNRETVLHLVRVFELFFVKCKLQFHYKIHISVHYQFGLNKLIQRQEKTRIKKLYIEMVEQGFWDFLKC